ncbi:MAG: acetyl-CoA carboxylase carboxyltransferase subunit alpha [Hespellia sp.]|nr:acetyl-CoA carboxylase carboxyltransferase subunit alpha [Hespellia sp.]
MKLQNMFKKTSRKAYITLREKPEVPHGLLRKCNKCGAGIMADDVKKGYYICPKCHGYFRIHAYRRVEMIADEGSFEEWDVGLSTSNPLDFRGYEEKVEMLQNKTNLEEAIVTGKIAIEGKPAVIGVCDGRFLMASMGEVVGEKIARAVERATEEKLPVIIFACSGGARMQEGIVSLMQMAKTSAALKRHSDAGQLYISVLTDPTTGGVTASFAMLGDIILAEPKALIGFAGPRVIEQTIGEKLPKGFQRSEFLLEHGFIDRIVEREEMKDILADILTLHQRCELPEKMEHAGTLIRERKKENESSEKTADEMEMMEESIELIEDAMELPKTVEMGAWERVQISRKKDRPVGADYIDNLFTNFIEFHGDRYFKDDKAIIGGVADFRGMPITVIAQAKGKNTKDNIERNFGMPSPEGYRKALRLMKQAEKFGRPVICFVDTPGAFCGLEAEERGQGEAIARNLFELSGLKVPVLSVVIGEGGSGGALAMAVADEVWMLENSIYSILSPEGFASILWKDSKRASEAAEVMKLTAADLKELGIIEQIIREPNEFTAATFGGVCNQLQQEIALFLGHYTTIDEKKLVEKRYSRFRNI